MGTSSEERIKQRRRERHLKDPRKRMLSQAKIRSKQKEMECTITLDDIKIPEFCPILKIPLFASTYKVSSNSPTLDRINNSKGYVKGNVAVISYRANNHKGDLTLENVENLLNYMKKDYSHNN